MTKIVKIECPELKNAVRALEKIAMDAPKAIARGMRAWGEMARTAAIKVTPKDTGVLRNTIFVDQKISGRVVDLSIGAGGPAAPYALVVHEKLGGVAWRTPGTGPKYIENPMRERLPLLDSAICKQVDKEFEK